jgi:hypothetical protein
MLGFATDLINGAALWKIILASLLGGAGVAIAFGLLLLAGRDGRQAGPEASQAAAGERQSRTLIGAFCGGPAAQLSRPPSDTPPAGAPSTRAVCG